MLFLILLLPLAMNGAGIGINGIWYNLNTQERTAEVTQGGNNVGGSIDSYLAAEYWNGFKEVKGISTITSTSCPDDHHPHVIDLGLPSGTKWACCNVGASTPEGYGSYFAWGETWERNTYNWENYMYCEGEVNTCLDLGSDISGSPSYDAAYVNMGMSWIMPSIEQMQELVENCTSQWTTVNGVNGRIMTGPNGASIFLPAAGYHWEDELNVVGDYGRYWSSSLLPSDANKAYHLSFYSGSINWNKANYRYNGYSVRPINQVVHLELAENIINMVCGKEKAVGIVGNGDYTVVSSDENVATAAISGNSVTVTAGNPGTATITVTDTRTDESANIEVMVVEMPTTLCPNDHHPHVIDLGLPSGTKWACCNVGASTPEGYGSYFAWGEVGEKSNYSWETYSHCDGTYETCHDLGNDIANSEYYDAAYVNMGMSWIMPSHEQQMELVEYCASEWTMVNGINGRIFIGSNGNSIFLPATGYRQNERLRNNGSEGYYWSSSQQSSKNHFAYHLLIRSGSVESDTWRSKYYGHGIRPIAKVVSLQLSESNIVLGPGEEEFVDILSGNGNYTITSSNSNVATATIVESTVIITAVGNGTATITVTDTQTGETATIALTVTENAPVVHLQLSENYAGMVLEEESSVDILSGSGRYTVTSSNPDVATATIEGSSVKINAVGAGSATITVKDMASEEIAHIQVTVVVYLYNPLTPSSPSPSNNVANVAPYGMFTWMISYYNGGKDIHYDLYLDTNSSFSNINGKPYHSGTGNSCSFSGLQPNTKYYWKVKVYNDKGQYAISDVWSFTTREKRLVTSTLRGDVNNDNMVSIADVMMMVNYIIGKPVSANFMAFNADVNSDASITITDVMKVVQIIIYGETAEPYLVVWHKDGSKIMFNLNEKPKVTYLGDNVTINGATTVECAFQAIRKMTFEKIEKPSSLLTVPFVNDGETVTFLPADKDLCVKVILPKGKLVKEFVVKKGEKATLPLDASTAKTYSMDVNGVTYKIKTR